MSRPTVKIESAEKIVKKLMRMRKTDAKKILRKATRAGASVVLSTVKKTVPVDHGDVRKMMELKIVTSGFNVTAIIGANVAKLQDAANTPDTVPSHRPSNIDWLLEDGHVNPDGSFTPPTGFMRRAAAASLPRASENFNAKLAKGIEQEAAK